MSIFRTIASSFVKSHSQVLTRILWGDIWNLRKYILGGGKYQKFGRLLYYSFFETYASCIGLGAHIEEIPCFPHGFLGIFISNSAKIGKGCVIFHQVTIGSNTIKDSPHKGAPNIGDNVYIGCGAKIIGNVTIGDNARIGANAIIVKDVPENSVTIMRGIETIVEQEPLDNKFIENRY